MFEEEKKLLSKRNIAAFLVLGILVLSIPLGLNLTKQRQTEKSQAAAMTQQAWIRDCEIGPSGVVGDTTSCPWRGVTFGSLEAYGPFKSYTGVVYQVDGSWKVRRLLLNEDGKTLYSCVRDLTPTKPMSEGVCNIAQGRFGIPGEESKIFNSIDEYQFDVSGTQYVHQTVIEDNGINAWIRDCQIGPSGVVGDTASCPWTAASFGSAISYGPFNSLSAVNYLENGVNKLRQLFLNINGKTLTACIRDFNPAVPPGLGACSYTNGRFGIPGEETKTFNGLNEFTFNSVDGKRYLHQTAIEAANPIPTDTPTGVPPAASPTVPLPSPTPDIYFCDANRNGEADDDDFTIWLQEYTGISQQTLSDCNSDGIIDIRDFNIWRARRFKELQCSI